MPQINGRELSEKYPVYSHRPRASGKTTYALQIANDELARLRALLEETRSKLRIARTAINDIAHGNYSMRDYANKVLAETSMNEKGEVRDER